MRTVLTIVFFFQLSVSMAQQIQTKYFSDKSLTLTVSERKAVYKKTTSIAPSGAITIEVLKIRNNQLISSEAYDGKEPIGKWIFTNAIGKQQELDYDFQLVYTKGLCEKDSTSYINFKKLRTYPFTDSDTLGYVAPKFATGEKNMSAFVNRRIVYPRQALEQEVSGTVQVQLIIGQTGQIEALAILNGINVQLDKEAMRIIKDLRFLNGASIGRTQKKVCAIVPITFMISD
jgi:TonB family protein